MAEKRRIVFVSLNDGVPWGGSEMLWSETALKLVSEGHWVGASVRRWPVPARQLSRLERAGIKIHQRWDEPEAFYPALIHKSVGVLFRAAARRRLAHWLGRIRPDMICISVGSPADEIRLMQICSGRAACVLLVQSNQENLWPDDARAELLIDVISRMRRNYFVSRRNCVLLETQLGVAIPNAGIVLNPFNVRRDGQTQWPKSSGVMRLACVARLEPPAKGQDILLHVLAAEKWRSRPIEVSFFGRGHMGEALLRLTERLGLGGRIKFRGHVDGIEAVWEEHHALVLPSRFEGLPLTIVEAMHCGRMVITTDVADNAEFLKDGVTGFIAEAATERHLDAALERAWDRRADWEQMGKMASASIRKLVPADPAADFARNLLELTATF